jgi:DNA-binding beta-propeller fold protein YncE
MIARADGTYLLGEHMLGEIPGFVGRGKVYHIAADGADLAEYDTQSNGGMGGFLGVTHMALNVDGSVLYHSTETGNQVYAHDLANDRQFGPVYTRSDPPGLVFGIALAPDNSGLLVACGNEMRLIGWDGDVERSFSVPGARGIAVPLARSETEFWALDFYTGVLTAFDLTSGQMVAQHSTGLAKCLTGMAMV